MSVIYIPNKDESYPVEIISYDLGRYRVRVRVTDGRKPFPQSGFFSETSYSDTGWVSANKCKIEIDDPTPAQQSDMAYGQGDLSQGQDGSDNTLKGQLSASGYDTSGAF